LKPNFRQGAGQQPADVEEEQAAPEVPPSRGSALRSSSGQWRSQHAQQREREVSGNSRVYRETHMRETYGGSTGKENYYPRGASLRSNSPKRNFVYQERVQYVPVMK